MKLATRVVHSKHLKVGEWFGSLELKMVPLDDHKIILGQDFINLSKAVPMPHDNYLMFLDGNRSYVVPMMTRRNLGRVPTMSIIKLIEENNESTNRPYLIPQYQEESA
jgi:hypothetical protein